MARPSGSMRQIIRDTMLRASRRMDGAAAAIGRTEVSEGEFDNHFDGVVTAIFHVADAVEMARTGVHRRVGDGESATIIRSVVATLVAADIGDIPAPARLIDLNARRNTSVHGHWTEVLDPAALENAIAAGRRFHQGASIYIEGRLAIGEED